MKLSGCKGREAKGSGFGVRGFRVSGFGVCRGLRATGTEGFRSRALGLEGWGLTSTSPGLGA